MLGLVSLPWLLLQLLIANHCWLRRRLDAVWQPHCVGALVALSSPAKTDVK